MATPTVSSKKRVSLRVDSTTRRRIAAIIAVATILTGLILMSVSKISGTNKVSSSQTQTIAQSLCPPPIVIPLEAGTCHITIIEHLPNLTADARITVYDENNSIVYQSSLFEEYPHLVKRIYNFTVVNSGVYNITLENAGVFFFKVEITTTTWENVMTYPFEPFFYYGLTIAAIGLCFTCLSLAIERKDERQDRSSLKS
jgi:hypothetical protein